jgi:hypothetical protein
MRICRARRAERGARLFRLAFAASLARPALVQAADLPGAELTVQRSPDTTSCPDEITIAARLRGWMIPSNDRNLQPLRLAVDLARDGDKYIATIRVEGRKQGVRTLQADGPTCEPLYEALMVSLLLLLDQDPTRADAPPTTSAPPPPTAPAPSPAAPAASAEERPTLWLSAGGALTHGFPEDWSGALFADAALRYGRWDFLLGAVRAPERSHPLEGVGSVAVVVSFWGARARGCYAPLVTTGGVRVGACALLVAGSLKGVGAEVTFPYPRYRPWVLAGASGESFIPLSRRFGLGISAAILIATAREQFNIVQGDRTLEPRYRSDLFAGWLGMDLRWLIW